MLHPHSLLLAAVAPYVGAWIETRSLPRQMWMMQSHPTWVRGLKLTDSIYHDIHILSHPTWVRGLKRVTKGAPWNEGVAPYVGAWIETDTGLTLS